MYRIAPAECAHSCLAACGGQGGVCPAWSGAQPLLLGAKVKVCAINLSPPTATSCLFLVLLECRFAAPMPKSRAIRFSSYAVLYQPDPQAYWQLCFRMASIRKHSLLKPEVRGKGRG